MAILRQEFVTCNKLINYFLTLFDIKRLLSATKYNIPANTRDRRESAKSPKTTNKQ